MEKRTSPRIFKLIKDEILKLRDEGQVLHTFKELRELLWRRLRDEPRFTDETLQTVIGLLDGPGVVKELDYGTYILLAPEWINACAQAVFRICAAPLGLALIWALKPRPLAWAGLYCAFGAQRFQANGLTQASSGQARNERRPRSGNKEWAKPHRGVIIPSRPATRLSRAFTGKADTARFPQANRTSGRSAHILRRRKSILARCHLRTNSARFAANTRWRLMSAMFGTESPSLAVALVPPRWIGRPRNMRMDAKSAA